MKHLKSFILPVLLQLLIAAIITSCNKDDAGPQKFKLPGITKENYPLVDGSTSTQPLQSLIACKLLDIDYEWGGWLTQTIMPAPEEDEESRSFIWNHVQHTGTHGAIINLINGNADIILVARKASAPELEVGKEKNVKLIETPVAIDAFIFILNGSNPVTSLTNAQIRDIYTGAITRWDQVEGSHNKINPYRRNVTSGSQVLMEELVMKGTPMMEMPEMHEFFSMMGPFEQLAHDRDGICYTVYYYKEFMVRPERVKHIAVDGVYPDYNTLRTREYPYATEVYLSIREDLNKSSMAYKLYELLLTGAGREVIKESGYVPY
jgi:phosphate transport system substrate-binding protein